MHQVEPGGRRRHFSRAFKRQIVEETLAGERAVSQIARDLNVNANLVFRWRRAYREGRFDDRASLVPVTVVADDSAEPASTSAATDARPVESRSTRRPGQWDDQLSITTADKPRLCRGQRPLPHHRIHEATCWAHVRRKFHDIWQADHSPRAKEAIDRIGALYAIEATIRGELPEV